MKSKPFAILSIFSHKVKCYWADISGTDRDGDYNYDLRRIRICTGLTKQAVSEILIHECIHAASAEMELGLEEKTVRLLGQGLSQLLEPYMKDIK